MARKTNNVISTPNFSISTVTRRKAKIAFECPGTRPTVWADFVANGYIIGKHAPLALADFASDLVEHARYRMAVAEARAAKKAGRAERLAARALAKIAKADAKRAREIARQQADADLHGKKGRRYAAGLRSSVWNLIKMGVERHIIREVFQAAIEKF